MSPEMKARTLRDVKRIKGMPGQEINSVEDIRRLVEEPLVKAAIIFFEKKIKTSWSSANPAFGFAAIVLVPESLSPKNLDLAKNRFNYSGEPYDSVMISVDTSPVTPIHDVEDYFIKVANLFEDQSEN